MIVPCVAVVAFVVVAVVAACVVAFVVAAVVAFVVASFAEAFPLNPPIATNDDE